MSSFIIFTPQQILLGKSNPGSDGWGTHGKEKCRNATQSLSGKPEAKIARKTGTDGKILKWTLKKEYGR